MTLAKVLTRALNGIHAQPVTVEAHISSGLPAFTIVGLPEAAVRESRDRVRAAIINSAFEFPMRRITVNLAPADLPKEGGRYDLPIALGVLAATDQIPLAALNNHEFHGELALSGELRPVSGALPSALGARDAGHILVLPMVNAQEAALVSNVDVRQARHLLDICRYLLNQGDLETPAQNNTVPVKHVPDMCDVRGQHRARRALEIAAAGCHNMLMIGPPGTGKTMLASRMPGILPAMSEQQALETAAIYSISNHGFDPATWHQRPYRDPHHTASGVALVGGGSNPRPGEISLSHNGVLFLDELTEFDRRVLDVLREPMESGRIIISRAARQAEFPARFQLIAAMNPCPQGYSCDGKSLCQCSLEQQRKHRARISAPLLDRIDIHVEVPRLSHHELKDTQTRSETSQQIRERVMRVYEIQMQRAGKTNAMLSGREVDNFCQLKNAESHLLEQAMDKFKLSARAYHRILRLARTIADLENNPDISAKHLAEAISYRTLDRTL